MPSAICGGTARHGLAREIHGDGFELRYLSHYNTILYLPAVLVRLLRKLLTPLRRESQYKTDFWIPPPLFNSLFAAVMASERFLIKKYSLPFGLSLIAATKK